MYIHFQGLVIVWIDNGVGVYGAIYGGGRMFIFIISLTRYCAGLILWVQEEGNMTKQEADKNELNRLNSFLNRWTFGTVEKPASKKTKTDVSNCPDLDCPFRITDNCYNDIEKCKGAKRAARPLKNKGL